MLRQEVQKMVHYSSHVCGQYVDYMTKFGEDQRPKDAALRRI